jgi:hypothetical protein
MISKKRTTLDSIFASDKPETAPLPPQPSLPQKTRTAAGRRTGKKQPTAYLDEVVHEQLRKLGFEERRKMHSYLMEGLDHVFADRGLPAIKKPCAVIPVHAYARKRLYFGRGIPLTARLLTSREAAYLYAGVRAYLYNLTTRGRSDS